MSHFSFWYSSHRHMTLSTHRLLVCWFVDSFWCCCLWTEHTACDGMIFASSNSIHRHWFLVDERLGLCVRTLPLSFSNYCYCLCSRILKYALAIFSCCWTDTPSIFLLWFDSILFNQQKKKIDHEKIMRRKKWCVCERKTKYYMCRMKQKKCNMRWNVEDFNTCHNRKCGKNNNWRKKEKISRTRNGMRPKVSQPKPSQAKPRVKLQNRRPRRQQRQATAEKCTHKHTHTSSLAHIQFLFILYTIS